MDVDEVIGGAYLEQVAARGHYVCTVLLSALNKARLHTDAIIRGRWTPRMEWLASKNAFPIRATFLILSSTLGRQ